MIRRFISSVSLPSDTYFQAKDIGKDSLLLLHGLFGSRSNFRSVAKRLSQLCDRTVHALDLRGHGGKETWPNRELNTTSITYEAMGDDVAQWITNHSQPVVLLGHSLGGRVALQVACTRPHLVSHLIVVDVAPQDSSATHSQNDALAQSMSLFHQYAQRLEDIVKQKLTKKSEADKALMDLVPDISVRQFLLNNLIIDPVEKHLVSRIDLESLLESIPNQLGKWPTEKSTLKPFLGPCTVIRGTNSKYIVPERDLPIFQKYAPQSKIIDIAGAGHWVHADKPSEFIQAVVQSLT